MVSYNVLEKVNPRDLEATRKYYAVKQNQGTVSVRQLARRISRETMLGLVETTAVIELYCRLYRICLLKVKW